ncbi:hypothetical protein H2200_011057 [Cladophialophora chaetospira]|uniref:Uncharacterized protein n=1 Tax=Cladophialophora chaetospira TaxID=386627 RepID=A0AA39CDE9_9EURO|nr:hypothetical protein H2200_011057 [Cladophialophora chaetospira]
MSQLRDLNVFKNWPRFLGKFAPSPTLEKLTLDDKNRDSPIPVIKLSFHTFMHYLKHPNLHHLVLHGRDNPTPLKPLGPEANQCGFDDCLSRFSIKTLTLSQNLVGGSLLDSLLRQFPKLKTLNIAAGKSIVWGSLTEPWTLSNSRGLYEAMLRCAGYLEELTIMPPDKLPSRETFVLGSLRSFTSLKSLVIDPKTLVGRQVGRKIESVYDEFSKELGWRCSFAAMLPQNLEHLGLLFDPMPTSNLHLNLEDILQGILVERNERLGLLTRITLYPRDEECGGGVLRGAVWACRDAGIEIRVIKTIKSYQTYFQGQWIQPEWPNWEK